MSESRARASARLDSRASTAIKFDVRFAAAASLRLSAMLRSCPYTTNVATIDTTTAAGKLVFGIFAALAEFERELIVERTKAGLLAARARGRQGGRPYKMTPAKLRLARAAMADQETKVADLCRELGVTRQTLYRHVGPAGELRADGRKLLDQYKRPAPPAR